MRWNQPPCKNMEENIVFHNPPGSVSKWAGIRPHVKMKLRSSDGVIRSSPKNASALRTINPRLTSGNMRVCVVSYSGIMFHLFYSLYSSNSLIADKSLKESRLHAPGQYHR